MEKTSGINTTKRHTRFLFVVLLVFSVALIPSFAFAEEDTETPPVEISKSATTEVYIMAMPAPDPKLDARPHPKTGDAHPTLPVTLLCTSAGACFIASYAQRKQEEDV